MAKAETAVEAKIRALGDALANGALANDDARLDEERIWVQVLAAVEAPQLRVLHVLSADKPAEESHFTRLYDQTGRAVKAFGTESSVIRERLISGMESRPMAISNAIAQ